MWRGGKVLWHCNSLLIFLLHVALTSVFVDWTVISKHLTTGGYGCKCTQVTLRKDCDSMSQIHFCRRPGTHCDHSEHKCNCKYVFHPNTTNTWAEIQNRKLSNSSCLLEKTRSGPFLGSSRYSILWMDWRLDHWKSKKTPWHSISDGYHLLLFLVLLAYLLFVVFVELHKRRGGHSDTLASQSNWISVRS